MVITEYSRNQEPRTSFVEIADHIAEDEYRAYLPEYARAQPSKQENFVTLHYRQLAPFMRRVGLVNARQQTLSELKRWLRRNKTHHNLNGMQNGDAINVHITAYEDSEIVDLLLEVR